MKHKEDSKLIGYCGLYCGNCILRIGEVADLAGQLLEKFQEIKFEEWAKGLASLSKELKAFENYESCYEILEAWQEMRCGKVCKEGGGGASCKIRICCQNKNIEGCWECEEYEDCKKLAWLRPINGEINIDNIRKIRREGIDKFIEEMKSKDFCDFYEAPKNN